MKFKFLVKIVEKLLGVAIDDNAPRADMYLPKKLFALALVCIGIGGGFAAFAILQFVAWAAVCAVLGIGLGIAAVLCWKNQSIHIISDEQFTYTTMFGNTRTYSFSDIQGVRKNTDSLTVFVAGEKVHIESMAVLSDRLIERINTALIPGAAYLAMSVEELSQLSDEELLTAVWMRAENIVASKDDLRDGFCALNEEQRIVYALYYLEMEVNNGGLCQFFVNSSRMVAPVVSHYMDVIGAAEHKSLYDAFIEKHAIDTQDLSSFDSETVEAFQAQYERYPFEEYDDAFYALEPLQNRLIPFVKKHIDKL